MLSTITSFFEKLSIKHDLNFSVFYDPYDFSLFSAGAWISLQLMFYSVLASLLVGVIGAWLQRSRFKTVSVCITSFVELFRNTPPMIQMRSEERRVGKARRTKYLNSA